MDLRKIIENSFNIRCNCAEKTYLVWLVIIWLLVIASANTEIFHDSSQWENKSVISLRIEGKCSVYLKFCFWNAFHITGFTKMEGWIHSLEVSKNVSAKCVRLLSHAKWSRASQASQAGIFGGWEYPGGMCILVCKYVGLFFARGGEITLMFLCFPICAGKEEKS